MVLLGEGEGEGEGESEVEGIPAMGPLWRTLQWQRLPYMWKHRDYTSAGAGCHPWSQTLAQCRSYHEMSPLMELSRSSSDNLMQTVPQDSLSRHQS